MGLPWLLVQSGGADRQAFGKIPLNGGEHFRNEPSLVMCHLILMLHLSSPLVSTLPTPSPES